MKDSPANQWCRLTLLKVAASKLADRKSHLPCRRVFMHLITFLVESPKNLRGFIVEIPAIPLARAAARETPSKQPSMSER
jgi:hypothetical protein